MNNMENKIIWYPFYDQEKVLLVNFKEKIQIENNFPIFDYLDMYHIDDIRNCLLKKKYTTIIFDEIPTNFIKKSPTFIQELVELVPNDCTMLFFVNNDLSLDKFLSYKYENKKGILFSEIDKYFNNLFGYKVFYPLLNKESINVIFTDDFLPSKGAGDKIINFSKKRYVSDPTKKILELSCEDVNILKYISNSFIVSIDKTQRISNFKLVSFQNMRKKEYSMITIMKDGIVEKRSKYQGNRHLLQMKNIIHILEEKSIKVLDTYDKNVIISKVVNEKTFDNKIKNIVSSKNECFELLNNFIELNFKKFMCNYKEDNVFKKYDIKFKNNQLSRLHFLDTAIYDMIFQNCFLINGEYYFFDQEWLENMVPLEFIIFRNYIYTNSLQDILTMEEISKYYDFEDCIDIFWELEHKLQDKINNEKVYELVTNNKTVVDEYNMQIKKIEDFEDLLIKQKDTLDSQLNVINNQNETIFEQSQYIKSLETRYDELLKKYNKFILVKIKNKMKNMKK